MEEKVLFKKRFRFKPFKRIIIGDPSYIDEYEKGTPDYNRLVADFSNSPKNKLGYIQVSCVEYSTGEASKNKYTSRYFVVDVATAPTEDIANVYLDGKFYSLSNKSVDVELGCDTARFDVETDFGFDTYSTGADGYYGQASVYNLKNKPFGTHIELTVSCDMYDYDSFVEKLYSIFEDMQPESMWKVKGRK